MNDLVEGLNQTVYNCIGIIIMLLVARVLLAVLFALDENLRKNSPAADNSSTDNDGEKKKDDDDEEEYPEDEYDRADRGEIAWEMELKESRRNDRFFG